MTLTCANNWEYLTYAWDGRPVEKITNVTVFDDDGFPLVIPAKFVEETRSYDDMGHTYSTRMKVLMVKWELLGIWVPIERDEVLKKIIGVHPIPKAKADV